MQFQDRLQTAINDLTEQVDVTDKEKISIGHQYRVPNCLNMKFCGDRIESHKIHFDALNVYFDIQQLSGVEIDKIINFQEFALYNAAWYYIPLQKSIQHDAKSDFTLTVIHPSYFGNGVFIYKPNVLNTLNSVVIDGKSVQTVNGFVKLEKGVHSITFAQGTQCIDIFGTQIFDQHPYIYYEQQSSSTVNVVQKEDLSLYFFAPNNTLQSLVLNEQYYVLNYFYEAAQQTTVYAKHLIEPIVLVKLV